MNTKRKSQAVRSVTGAPAEVPFSYVLGWFVSTIGKLEGDNTTFACAARADLHVILGGCISQLLYLALRKQGAAKQWAGNVLAPLHFSLEKHHEKLSGANSAYRRTDANLRKQVRRDVLFSRTRIGRFLRKELRKAERYQSHMLVLRNIIKGQGLWTVGIDNEAVQKRLRDQIAKQKTAFERGDKPPSENTSKARAPENNQIPGLLFPSEITEAVPGTWQKVARQRKIPEEYWPVVDLPPFGMNSEGAWFKKFVWPLVKKRNQQGRLRLPRLQRRLLRRPSATGAVKAITPPLSDYHREFHNHWRTLARLRTTGNL